MPLHPVFQTILAAHTVSHERVTEPVTRAPTVKAHPDYTGLAPRNCAWSAYDENTYDGAPDAGPQVVGWGATAEEAFTDYDAELAASSES